MESMLSAFLVRLRVKDKKYSKHLTQVNVLHWTIFSETSTPGHLETDEKYRLALCRTEWDYVVTL